MLRQRKWELEQQVRDSVLERSSRDVGVALRGAGATPGRCRQRALCSAEGKGSCSMRTVGRCRPPTIEVSVGVLSESHGGGPPRSMGVNPMCPMGKLNPGYDHPSITTFGPP